MKALRIFDLLQQNASRNPDTVALSGKRRGKWVSYTYREYKETVDRLSIGLLGLGLAKGDRIASMTPNRPEWNFLDMASHQIGAVHVSVFPNYCEQDLLFILEQTGAKYLFVGNWTLQGLAEKLRPKLPELRQVFVLDRESQESYASLLADRCQGVDRERLDRRKQTVTPDDPYSIYYTSGTAMSPKGVIMQHRATAYIESLSEVYGLNPGEVVLSYLPLCHSYERAHNYIYQYCGASIHYAESAEKVMANINEIRPVMFTSVPMLLEKVIEGIDRPQKDLLGGKLRLISSAGAPLPESYAKKLSEVGIPVLECYGTTECNIITTNAFKDGIRFNTVGLPGKNVKVKLNPDGEILVKGPYMMSGYYKLPELTEKAFDREGFYRTGDIGRWIDGRFLQITGRKKDIFKSASGRFIVPEAIEKKLLDSYLIMQVMVYERQGLPAVLIVPQWMEIEAIRRERSDAYWQIDKTALACQLLKEDVNRYYNQAVVSSEQLRYMSLLEQPWTVGGGELTPTMKIKRDVIAQRCSPQIQVAEAIV